MRIRKPLQRRQLRKSGRGDETETGRKLRWGNDVSCSGESEGQPQTYCQVMRTYASRRSASPHHRITASPHHRITASPHHRTASPHHRITAAPQHRSTAASPHHRTASPHHRITAAPQHRSTAAPKTASKPPRSRTAPPKPSIPTTYRSYITPSPDRHLRNGVTQDDAAQHFIVGVSCPFSPPIKHFLSLTQLTAPQQLNVKKAEIGYPYRPRPPDPPRMARNDP